MDSAEASPGAHEGSLVVLRCSACGDTFPVESVDEASCPSCGATELEVATEPLL